MKRIKKNKPSKMKRVRPEKETPKMKRTKKKTSSSTSWGGHIKNPPDSCPAKRWQVNGKGEKLVDTGVCVALCGIAGSLSKDGYCEAAKTQLKESMELRKQALLKQPPKKEE